MKVFLLYAPTERPLLLLQDGASAHLGIDLIDAAIANDVILLCFPPKLTHILQPCDVGIYRTMKANVSHTMQQIRLLRGEMWVNKGKLPAILRDVFEKTFTPSLVIGAFRKRGIVPFSRNSIDKDLMKSPIEGTVIAELKLDVVSPSQVPADVEVLTSIDACDVDGTSHPCPHHLALDAIQGTLTQKKLAAYQRRHAHCDDGTNDAVYATWRFLKTRVDGQQAKPLIVAPTPVDEHPLLKAGLIPKRLVDVFTTPPEEQTGLRARRGATTKARVLTSDEISNEIREGDTKRKLVQTEKEHKKKIRLLKKTQKPPRQTTRRTRKAKPAGATATSVATAAHSATDRHDYFASIQGLLVNCRSYASMKLTIPDTFLYPFEPTPPSETTLQGMPEDAVAAQLLSQVTGIETSTMWPVHVLGDGNCCPRSASLLFTGSNDRHTEMRVRIVRELLLHDDRYLDSSFLCQGIDRVDTTLPAVHAQYSPGYVPGSKLSDADIRNVYERETMSVVRSGAYCGIWQLHALASVVNRPIRSIYRVSGRRRVTSVACCSRDNNPAWQTITGTQ